MFNPFEQLEQLKGTLKGCESALKVISEARTMEVDGKEVDSVKYVVAAAARIGAHVAAIKEEIAKLEKELGEEFGEIKQALEIKE